MKSQVVISSTDELVSQKLKAKLTQEGYDVEIIPYPRGSSSQGEVHSISKSSGLQLVPTQSQVDPVQMSYTEIKKKWCDAFEKQYLTSVLNKNEGNVSAAARDAKLDRSNFLRLLRKHGIKAQEFRSTEELKAA